MPISSAITPGQDYCDRRTGAPASSYSRRAVCWCHSVVRNADARAAARDIVAEAERAAQDIVTRAVKIKAEADRMLDDAKSKAACIEKRAQAALARAENIAEGRRLILALSG
jgi:cell division septum initiation protein DivIVA